MGLISPTKAFPDTEITYFFRLAYGKLSSKLKIPLDKTGFVYYTDV
jgi:hypothetical protein